MSEECTLKKALSGKLVVTLEMLLNLSLDKHPNYNPKMTEAASFTNLVGMTKKRDHKTLKIQSATV